jgi:pimeloyl-ACP methyl ester carboxylesterase
MRQIWEMGQQFAPVTAGPAPALLATILALSAISVRMLEAQPLERPPGYASLREGVADVPGAALYYVDSGGSGPAVVLLHAGTGSSQVWEHQFPALSVAGYRVVAYDRRGYGRTTVIPDGPVSTAADDLDALLSALKIDRAFLVGTAAGGIVATDFALAFGHRVRGLVIANSLVGVQDPEYLALGRRLRPPAFAALPADLRELSPSYRAANPEGTARWLALEHASRAPGPAPPPQSSKSHVTFAALAGLAIPTLLITGESDLYTPPPVLTMFAARLPRSETLVLHDVGHSAYWEAPEAFNRAVLGFLGRLR